MKICRVFLIALLVVGCSYKKSDTVVDVFQNRSPNEAFNQVYPLALKGNADAEFLIGHFYRQGKGVEKDLKKALEFYEKAAQKDQPCALNDLAFEYKMGENLAKDYQKVLSFAERAIRSNHPTALVTHAQMYYFGQGVEINKEYAFNQFQRALSLGSPQATYSIGQYYIERDLSPKDLVEGFKWLEIYRLWALKNKSNFEQTYRENFYNETKTKMSIKDVKEGKNLAKIWFEQNGKNLLTPIGVMKKCFEN